MIMENAPNIILFWYFIIVIFVFVIALMIAANILIKKCRERNAYKLQLLGQICLGLDLVCAIPIILVVGYILYLRIG